MNCFNLKIYLKGMPKTNDNIDNTSKCTSSGTSYKNIKSTFKGIAFIYN